MAMQQQSHSDGPAGRGATLHGIIPHVLREHVEQAAFQWAQQLMLAQAHPADQAAINHVSARLIANLDAIRIAGDPVWPIIVDRFEDYPEAGELFVATHLATATGDAKRIEQCLWMAHQHPEARAGLTGALLLLPPASSGPVVKWMLQSDSPVIRATALDVLTHHRSDAGTLVTASLSDSSPLVQAAACDLAAATGRRDCAHLIAGLTDAQKPDLRFAALSALAAMGHAAAPAALKAEIAEGSRAEEALRLLQRALPPADFLAYAGTLYQREESRALAVRAIGMTGDRSRLAWLIKEMTSPETAIAAGESFLELFPEANGVEGLFSSDPKIIGPRLAEVCEGGNTSCPVAAAIEAWAAHPKQVS